MSVSRASEDRYSSAPFVAAYLEAEWSDCLFPRAEGASPRFGGLRNIGPSFYRNVVGFAQSVLTRSETLPRYTDIGAATGRMIFEWLKAFGDEVAEAVHVKPAPDLQKWAQCLLGGVAGTCWVPRPRSAGNVDYLEADLGRIPQISRPDRIKFHNGAADAVPRPRGYFDAVTCLNVVDRVGKPRQVTRDVCDLVRWGGWLFLASPIDWDERFTPRSNWVEDVADLFPADWDPAISEDIEYDFRYSSRKAIRFHSQVVARRKK